MAQAKVKVRANTRGVQEAPGVIEALISAKSVPGIMQVALQSHDQVLQAEDAPGVAPGRLLADLVEALGEGLAAVDRVLELHQILHVLSEDVGAADFPAVAGELERILVRSRPPAVVLLHNSRVLLRRLLDYSLLTRLEGGAREGGQFRWQGRVVAVLVHRLRPGIMLLDSHGDRAGLRCEHTINDGAISE